MHGEYETTCSWFLTDDELFLHQMAKSGTHPPSFRRSTSRPACPRFPPSLAFFPSSSRLCFLGTFLLSPIHLSFVDDFLCFVHFSYPIFNFVTTNLYDILMQTDRQSRVVFFLNPIDFYPSIRIAGGAQRIYCPPISAFDLIFVYILYLCFESLLLFRYRSAASLFFDRLSLYHHTRHDYLFAMMPRYLALYSFLYLSPSLFLLRHHTISPVFGYAPLSLVSFYPHQKSTLSITSMGPNSYPPTHTHKTMYLYPPTLVLDFFPSWALFATPRHSHSYLSLPLNSLSKMRRSYERT